MTSGGEIKGIGKLSIPVIGRFMENVRLGSSQMEEWEFLVTDGDIMK